MVQGVKQSILNFYSKILIFLSKRSLIVNFSFVYYTVHALFPLFPHLLYFFFHFFHIYYRQFQFNTPSFPICLRLRLSLSTLPSLPMYYVHVYQPPLLHTYYWQIERILMRTRVSHLVRTKRCQSQLTTP